MRKSIASLFIGAVGCTSLLGDFQTGDAAPPDTGTPDTSVPDTSVVDTGTPDTGIPDTGIPDTTPPCGGIGQACCGSTCTFGVCCGGVCADTVNDGKNCGTCGHDCLGASCNTRMCVPTQLAKISAKDPGGMAVDASDVYLALPNGGGTTGASKLLKCTKTGSGCGTTPIELITGMYFAEKVVLDPSATWAYTSDFNAGKLLVCATAGCSQNPSLVYGNGQIQGFDLRTYFFASTSANPHQFDTDGSNEIDLGSGNEGSYDVTAPPGSAYVYWTDYSGSRVRVAKEGNTGSEGDFWTSSEYTSRITSDSSHVIWEQVDTSGFVSLYSCGASLSCSSATVLATKQSVGYRLGGIVSDGTNVYWTTIDYGKKEVRVRSCAVGGCSGTPTDVAVVTYSSVGYAGGVTFDKFNVYFSAADTSPTTFIYRVAK